MPRYMSNVEGEDRIWRAVITTTYPNGKTHTSYLGPFTTRRPAKAAITRELRWSSSCGGWRTDGAVVTGRVESAPVNWESDEDDG